MEWLFPSTHLVVDQVFPTFDRLEIKAHSDVLPVACPECGIPSARVQGHYLRSPHDLPCGPYPLRLRLKVRRFYCLNPECERTTFSEGFPRLLRRKAQRTVRLKTCHAEVGLSLSGEAGAHLLIHLGMSISPDSVLNSVKGLEIAQSLTPKVLGVDDFAFKRGQKYGTVLIDLEKRRVVDLLPDREASTLAAWLKAHPGVETVTRDRYKAYQNAITEGAPEATQVADRWHLLHNLADTVKVWLERHRPLLLEPNFSSPLEPPKVPTLRPHRHEETNQTRIANRESRMRHFEQVLNLKRQGLNPHEIAEQVSFSLATVYRFFKHESFPERKPHHGSVADYLPYLQTRLNAGCTNVLQLHRELLEQGYIGSSETVSAGVLLLQRGRTSPHLEPSPARYSVRDGVHLFITPPEQLSALEQARLEHLCTTWPQAVLSYQLTQRFRTLFKCGGVAEFRVWLTEARQGEIREFRRLARGLSHDQKAVEASLTTPWSNGQVEGHVNRLKLIKRQHYGRAGFELLRRRVIGAGRLSVTKPVKMTQLATCT